jgi:hypothetical protein
VSDARKMRPGEDSRVTDWFGQNVDRDAELADELVDEHGEADAAEHYAELADGEAREEARRGDQIDPQQGEEAYRGNEP